MAEPDDRVAIVLTCYDTGEPLVQAVASVRDEAAELVIVDDGSTDRETVRILRACEQEGLRVVHRPNGGLSAALMTGVRATSSPYVMRFDSDDLLDPGAIARLANALDANPDAVLAWGDLHTFGLTTVRVPSVPVLDAWHLTFVNILPAGSLFRRTALLDVGGWRLRGGYEDWDVLMSFAERGDTGIYVPGVVYRYRRAAAGLLVKSLEQFDEHYEELRRLHPQLFLARSRNRHRSRAPRPLKVLLPLIDVAPGLSRLRKVQLAQLLTHLFWNGGVSGTARLLAQTRGFRRRTQ